MTPELIGAIISILALLGGLIKVWTKVGEIQAQRLETSTRRDGVETELRDKIMRHDWELKYAKDELQFLNSKNEDLSKQIQLLTTEVTKMSVNLENLLNRLDKIAEAK